MPMKYFNPRGPLGPRHYHPVFDALVGLISIHAVLWDREIRTVSKEDIRANSIPCGPLGQRRTSLGDRSDVADRISIHAVLWDRDREAPTIAIVIGVFQSTRSSGTATVPVEVQRTSRGISIHAVLWDRDLYWAGTQRRRFTISIHAVLWDRDL